MMMPNGDGLQRALDELTREYGEWTYDIPLPFGIWTRGNEELPHTRLRRIVQVVSDLSARPLSESRILDLGCLEGLYSIEFAMHGARTIGVEIREASIKKAIFCQEALGLSNLEFRQGDVRNVTLESYGAFDAIVCSGILYHLRAADAANLISSMYAMVKRVVVIDTHVALEPVDRFTFGGHEYRGRVVREHADDATPEEKAKEVLASFDNPTSFLFTRPSLISILRRAGFSSVFECFEPAHLNFGQPGLEHRNRCTFVAVKGQICQIATSPSVNAIQEQWPEDSLSYAPQERLHDRRLPLYSRGIARLRQIIRTVSSRH